MTDEKSGISLVQYRELGIPCPRVSGLCKHQGNILVQFNSEVSEMERIYTLPACPVKWGERSRDALKRNFKENFAMDISVGRFVLVVENKYNTFDGRVHSIDLVFEIQAQSATFDILVPGIGARWIDMNGIDRYNLQPEELREALFTQTINQRKHMIAGDLKFIR